MYRGKEFPALQGCYISADFFSGIFYKIIPNGSGGWTVGTQTLSPTGIVDFGETENGEVYAVSNTRNGVYRITPVGTTPTNDLQGGKALASIYPSLISDGKVQVDLHQLSSYQYFELIDLGGRVVFKTELSKQTGSRTISLTPNLAAGMYLAKVSSGLGVSVQKVYVQ